MCIQSSANIHLFINNANKLLKNIYVLFAITNYNINFVVI